MQYQYVIEGFPTVADPAPPRKRRCNRRADSILSHKKHFKEQQNQRKAAGKNSAIARANGAAQRRIFVKSAFEQLTSFQRACPYSAKTIDVLEATYKRLLVKAGFDRKTLTRLPFKVGRETLKSDLKRLGIRGWGRPQPRRVL